MIDSNNYSYCCYQNNNYKSIISFGMDPNSTCDELDYFVTVIKDDNTEIIQHKFNSLNAACEYANDKYSKIWQFKNMTLKEASSAGGCSTCVAH